MYIILDTLYNLVGNYGDLTVQMDSAPVKDDLAERNIFQLTCTTSGPPVYSIHWLKDDILIYPSCKYTITSSSLETSVLTIYNASSDDSGTYKCIAYSYYAVQPFIAINNISLVGECYI